LESQRIASAFLSSFNPYLRATIVWIRENEKEPFSECVQNDGQCVQRPVAAGGKLCHFETSADPIQQKFPPEIPFAIRRDSLKMMALFHGPRSEKPNHSPEAKRIDCRLQPTCTLRAAQKLYTQQRPVEAVFH
jgi:hypothetical protein